VIVVEAVGAGLLAVLCRPLEQRSGVIVIDPRTYIVANDR
jgi:hypothetical protein